MSFKVLVLGNKEKEQLVELKRTGEENPLMPAQLMTGVPIGDNPNHVAELGFVTKFRVVFSIEKQPFGYCRHLSVSTQTLSDWPHPNNVEQIARELGFKSNIEKAIATALLPDHEEDPRVLLRGEAYAYPEKLDVANMVAINILEHDPKYAPILKPGVIPKVPPYEIHGDSAQYGGQCMSPDCKESSNNPLADSDAKYYPTHTHGLFRIGWSELFINATAFGAQANAQIINEIWCLMWLNPSLKEELDKKDYLEIDPDILPADDHGGSFMIRKVVHTFTGVEVTYTPEEIEDCMKTGFAQIYVKGDRHVLEDQYYSAKHGTA